MHMCMSVGVVPYTCICVPSFVIIVHALGAFCKPPHSSCHEMERHGPMDIFVRGHPSQHAITWKGMALCTFC